MRYLAAASALAASMFVYAFFAGLAQHPAPQSTPSSHQGCIQLTASPTTMACPDRHVYLVPGWIDVGPVTPVPGVPSR